TFCPPLSTPPSIASGEACSLIIAIRFISSSSRKSYIPPPKTFGRWRRATQESPPEIGNLLQSFWSLIRMPGFFVRFVPALAPAQLLAFSPPVRRALRIDISVMLLFTLFTGLTTPFTGLILRRELRASPFQL